MIEKRIIFALARLGVVLIAGATCVVLNSACGLSSTPSVASADVALLITKNYGDCTGGRKNPLEIVNSIWEWGLIVEVRDFGNSATNRGYPYKKYCFWSPMSYPNSCFNLDGSSIQQGAQASRLLIQVPSQNYFQVRVALVSACDGCQSGDTRYSVIYAWYSGVTTFARAQYDFTAAYNQLFLRMYTNNLGQRQPELYPCPSLGLPQNTCPNCLPFNF